MFYTYVNNIGNQILHRWVDEDGERHSEMTQFAPTLYVQGEDDDNAFEGIRKEKLAPVEFGDIKDAREYIREYQDISNFPIFGNTNWWAQFIQSNYTGAVDWNMKDLVVANLDIEVLINDPDNPGKNPIENPIEAVNRITAITVEVNNKYIVFGSKEYTGKKLPLNATHMYCETEEDLLVKFLTMWKNLEPDVVTGWNINYFDIPYLIGRIRDRLGGDMVNYLGPTAAKYTNRVINIREFSNGNGIDVSILGLSCLDYLEMYKKFTYKMRERYSLDYIAYCELGEKKLDYSEYGNLDDLYENDYNKYIDYNIKDVELIRRLDNKLNLMMLVMTLTYMCHIRHEDVFSQVRMWDTLIYNNLLDKNVVIPPKGDFHKDEKYEGAYVREPKVGMHDWVVSFDLNSLYPHLIMQYNISPEMLFDREFDEKLHFNINDLVNGTADLDFLKDEDLSMTANKAFFLRDERGFLAQMMDDLYKQRKTVKKGMLAAEAQIEVIKGILKERGVEL